MSPNEVEAALYKLNDRLRRVEVHLGLRAPDASPAPTPEPVVAPPPPQAATQAPPPRRTPPVTASQPANPGNWLGIAAVLCFILAAGFIVKLALDSGWLTAARQLGLASLFGFGLIGAGIYLARTDRAYASLLPAAGIIVLYLTVFAAHSLYHLLPLDIALGLTAAISGLCIWLYTLFRHDVYSITAAVGAYAAPFVLDLGVASDFTLYYDLVCTLAFATISLWIRTRALTVVAAYLALMATAISGLTLHADGLVAGCLGLHFLIFAAATVLYSLETKTTLNEAECWALLPVLLAFYALEYYFIARIAPMAAPWVSLGFAGVLIALYALARRYLKDDPSSQGLVMIFATIVAFHSVYLELLPPMARPGLLVLMLLACAFASPARRLPRPIGLYIFPLAAVGIIAINEYLTMLYSLLVGLDSWRLIAALATLAAGWVVILRRNQAGAMSAPDLWGYGLLAAAHLLAIIALYRLAEAGGSLAVSGVWLFYAAAVIVIAFTRKDETMAQSALIVLALAAGKALLYDAASAPSGVRIICLLLTGGVLYGCGLLMRRIGSWKAGA